MPRKQKTLYDETLRITSDTKYAARALAYFLFREIIEDAHTKYNISQEDVKAMTKMAVNRAALYLRMKDDAEQSACLLSMQGAYVHNWDSPVETADVRRHREFIEKQAEILRYTKGKGLSELNIPPEMIAGLYGGQG